MKRLITCVLAISIAAPSAAHATPETESPEQKATTVLESLRKDIDALVAGTHRKVGRQLKEQATGILNSLDRELKRATAAGRSNLRSNRGTIAVVDDAMTFSSQQHQIRVFGKTDATKSSPHLFLENNIQNDSDKSVTLSIWKLGKGKTRALVEQKAARGFFRTKYYKIKNNGKVKRTFVPFFHKRKLSR